MSDAITSTKTGADGGNIFGQPMLFDCMGICVLSPAHGNEMRYYSISLVFVDVFFNSATVYWIGRPYRGFCFCFFCLF